ncbi:MAG: (d)CMP kinase [Lentisphaerae bacterium]|nr:(d)CMP kinase [Lentisphaerota bacterium]
MVNVIAIDGPSASGKSTLAKTLSEKLHIPYINTGSMFRATALAAQNRGISWDDEAALQAMLRTLSMEYRESAAGGFELFCDGEFPGEKLRTAEIAAGASKVAVYPAVREELKNLQRKMSSDNWIVMEGRDIGTVIFPDAAYKFFITASPLERARRRLAQEGDKAGGTLEEVAAAIAKRDEQDSNRPVAPLKPANDADLVDNSNMTLEETFNYLYNKVKDAVL